MQMVYLYIIHGVLIILQFLSFTKLKSWLFAEIEYKYTDIYSGK